MTNDQRKQYLTREAILNVLSDEENAKVSTAEGAPALTNGEEYLDLEGIDLGVQRVSAGSSVAVGHVIPRAAVSNETWSKIKEMLKT
jgi:hypothetical protein